MSALRWRVTDGSLSVCCRLAGGGSLVFPWRLAFLLVLCWRFAGPPMRFTGVSLTVRWRFPGGSLAVRWRFAGGSLAVRIRFSGATFCGFTGESLALSLCVGETENTPALSSATWRPPHGWSGENLYEYEETCQPSGGKNDLGERVSTHEKKKKRLIGSI